MEVPLKHTSLGGTSEEMRWVHVGKLSSLMRRQTRTVVGLMSGTSVDGIDAALVKILGQGAKTKVELIGFCTQPFCEGIRRQIFRLFDPATGNVADICHMNFVLGKLFAQAALEVIAQCGLTPRDVDLIGSHGQTIYHRPAPTRTGEWETRSTLQIGEGAVIAEETGIVTVSDFRVRDVAAGGQGAPLVPYVDWLLFHHPTRTRVVQNIGGIGNVSVVNPHAVIDNLLAFDTGPGNMIIDGITSLTSSGTQTYDADGAIAAAGKVQEALLAELMSHPFFYLSPPKTTGREEFGLQYSQQLLEHCQAMGLSRADILATVTAFTAESIAAAYRDWVIPIYGLDEVIVGGGGSRNRTLLRMLAERLDPIPVYTHEDFGISSDAKEALAFAVLANDTIAGAANNVISATGASHPVVMGKISL